MLAGIQYRPVKALAELQAQPAASGSQGAEGRRGRHREREKQGHGREGGKQGRGFFYAVSRQRRKLGEEAVNFKGRVEGVSKAE